MDFKKVFGQLFGGSKTSSTPPTKNSLNPMEFRRLMDEAGLSSYTESILAIAANSIRLDCKFVDEKSIAVGASKLLGLPDLPPEIEWPWSNLGEAKYDDIRAKYSEKLKDIGVTSSFNTAKTPLCFLAQIRLEDIASLDTENKLPHTGMLYFFYDAANQPIPAEDPTGWRVIYYNGDLGCLQRTSAPPELPDRVRYNARSITARNELTLPDIEHHSFIQIGMPAKDLDKYCNELERWGLYDDRVIHRLLGWPDLIQGDVFYDLCHDIDDISYSDPQMIPKADEWTLLFQMDSVDNGKGDLDPMWGDAGRLYFCINKDELSRCDFSNVWVVEQCG